jgi:DNA-binding response OmpR family regulator
MQATLRTTTTSHAPSLSTTIDFATVKKILTGHRAVVLDDDCESFGRLFLSLSTAGCPATLARRWAQIEPAVRRVKPTLIIFSTTMQDLGGLEIVRRLRDAPATQDAIIVARSAAESRTERRRLLAAGCDGYLWKPTDRYLFATDLLTATPRLIAPDASAA